MRGEDPSHHTYILCWWRDSAPGGLQEGQKVDCSGAQSQVGSEKTGQAREPTLCQNWDHPGSSLPMVLSLVRVCYPSEEVQGKPWTLSPEKRTHCTQTAEPGHHPRAPGRDAGLDADGWSPVLHLWEAGDESSLKDGAQLPYWKAKLSVREPGPPCHLHQQNGSAQGSGEGERGGSNARKAVKFPDPGTKGGLVLRRETGQPPTRPTSDGPS